ncbi:MAG: hypothetical protein ACFFEA_07630 [Candidatus Thorarchaeota archaeon]
MIRKITKIIDSHRKMAIVLIGNEFVEQMKAQFRSCWLMLRQAIRNVPDEYWSMGLIRRNEPWVDTEEMNIEYYSYVVLHLLESVEFYSQDDTNEMIWGAAIGGIDWKKESPQETASRISKEAMLEYSKKIESLLEAKLNSLSEKDLLEPDGFSRSYPNRLAKYLNLMRHTMFHIGELARVLRNCNCERLNWESE